MRVKTAFANSDNAVHWIEAGSMGWYEDQVQPNSSCMLPVSCSVMERDIANELDGRIW